MDATLGRQGSGQQPAKSYSAPAMLMVLLVKGKALLLGLVKLKYFYTALTAIVSVFAYSGRFGLAAAAGFVGLIFVHEMGHVIMLRHYGVPASVPLFIPFLGAFIQMKGYPKDVVKEAYVALAGPVLGSAGALACLAAYFSTHDPLWAFLAYAGFFLNLFNLLPMSPLDGGRVIAAVWRGFWIVGIVAAVMLANFLASPIILLFAVFGLDEINRRFMRVHTAFYILLGVLGVISAAMFNEIFWGLLIMFFAFSHARGARQLNMALEAQAKLPARFQMAGAKYCPVPFAYPQDGSGARGLSISKWNPKPISNSDDRYFKVPRTQRLIIGAVYVGLSITLSGLVYWMHQAGIFNHL